MTRSELASNASRSLLLPPQELIFKEINWAKYLWSCDGSLSPISGISYLHQSYVGLPVGTVWLHTVIDQFRNYNCLTKPIITCLTNRSGDIC